ncbi:hypothetical protein TVAG_237180 [Trichomonas vaginalis G3]|uniref:Uncharacterized protein n=1 Tax=Trichomonas vaginalis (strain ATCC PRA-98 / G3) TaxID=412133 RepID=A2DCR8_TRIV3|nr:hypothetical protein TVAGG3_0607100 [Trichomonas vaginalis G3]EAY21692.1 hypothetical protein TVAG_237180 [Trichomonas vaginalis G3]KAI5524328.1 hypothetical protein TVAGG3_0607100 [Trichomonas vaginalis G3]|eukprot:XP_001582678.1 hypothetical protein [Trichomonas vaginalis G3]
MATKVKNSFPECQGKLVEKKSGFQAPSINSREVKAGEFFCIYGAAMVASNSNISASSYFTKVFRDKSLVISEKVIPHPFILTNKIEKDDIDTVVYDIGHVSKIYCDKNSASNCDVQYTFIPQPFNISTIISINGHSIKFNDEHTVIITSGQKSVMNNDVYLKIEQNKSISYKSLSFIITNPDMKKLQTSGISNNFKYNVYSDTNTDSAHDILITLSSSDKYYPPATPMPTPFQTPFNTPFQTPFSTPHASPTPLPSPSRSPPPRYPFPKIPSPTALTIPHDKLINEIDDNTDLFDAPDYYKEFFFDFDIDFHNDITIVSKQIDGQKRSTKSYYPDNFTHNLDAETVISKQVIAPKSGDIKPTPSIPRSSNTAVIALGTVLGIVLIITILLIVGLVLIIMMIKRSARYNKEEGSDSRQFGSSESFGFVK